MLNLIDSKLVRQAGTIYGNLNSLRLREQDPGAKLKELVLTHMSADSIVCDLDPVAPSAGKKLFGRYSWFFNSTHPLAPKQCDGAVHVEYRDREYLILLEMKSSASGMAKGRKQLKSGQAFAAYIQSLLGRELHILTRLVYLGPMSPAPASPRVPRFLPHMEIPVISSQGRAYLSFSQLIS